MSRTSFGIRLPHCGPFASAQRVGETARLSENLGYASVWTNDYVVWTRELHDVHLTAGAVESLAADQEPYYLESLGTLAHLSGLTERVQLGIAVLVAPYRHPVLTARELSTLNSFAPGRVIAGFGVGAGRQTKNPNFDALGLPIDERVAMTAEYLRAVRTLLHDGGGSFHGTYVAFEDAVIAPRAGAQVPMWMGGSSKGALRMAAESCDGWMPTWFQPRDYERAVPQLHEMLRDQGRSPDSCTIAREIYLCIDVEGARARSTANATLENNARWFTVRGVKDYDDRLDLVRSSSLVGSPAEITQGIAAYAEAGVTHLEFKVISRTYDQFLDMLQLFAAEVMPHFADSPIDGEER